MLAGIIGGTGRMGRFFQGVFLEAGWDVIVSGTHTSLSNRDVAEQSDLVVVSVPIRKTVEVIHEIAPVLREEQVLCDLTSLKAEPVQAMLTSKAEVIGMHPMFGPGAESLKNQTIIVTPARCREETLQRLLGVFQDQGACITITTPEEHDSMMAIVQGLTHFSTLCMAETIRRLDRNVPATLEYTSPIYRIQMGLIGRILAQDAGLYGDILELNPEVPKVLAAFLESARVLREIVTSGDPAAFSAFFGENSRHYADYAAAATEETDALINYVVNR
jgi:prephenate dehydrogenase